MPHKLTAFLLSFLTGFFLYSFSAPSDGSWVLCDLKDTAGHPITLYGQPVLRLHRELWEKERRITALDRQENRGNTTNFVTAKLGFYRKDDQTGEMQASFRELHELFSLSSLPLVFDSSAKRSDMQKLCTPEMKISIRESPLAVEEIKRVVTQNFTPLRTCEKEALGLLQRQLKVYEDSSETAFKAFESFQKEFDNYQSHFRKIMAESSLINRGVYVDMPLSDGSGELKNQEEKRRKTCERATAAFNQLIKNFYHSEPRVLRVFQENSINFLPHEPLESVILHLHSTYNSCDCCRMQFTGACYNWLYGKMKNYHVKFFHIVVTWFGDPKRQIEFGNPKEYTEISDHMASITHTHLESPFTEGTPSFVTFVKLLSI